MDLDNEQLTIVNAVWETAVEPFLIINNEGMIQHCNRAASRWAQLQPNQSLPQSLDHPEPFFTALNEAWENKKCVLINQISLQTHEGKSMNARMRLSPLINATFPLFLASLEKHSDELDWLQETARMQDQRVEQLRENLSHVSQELLNKTLQLAEQNNKLGVIINSMNEGLIACDQAGHIIQANETARDLLELEAWQPSMQIHEICPPVANALNFNPQNTENLTAKNIDLSFNEKELRISLSPIVDKENAFTGFVMIIENRTEQARIERLKSDLISIVSHELRSPLTSIKGYVDLMMSGDLGRIEDPMISYLGIVSSNANRLAALIDDILDLTRMESGKLSLNYEKVDVRYLCEYVFLTLKPQAEQKNLSYELIIHTETTISGDLERLQQALTNLLSNAIKYTQENGRVELQAQQHKDWIHITVQDTGIGISHEDQKMLFQRFFRVKNKETRHIGGTGLGLCIAKSIIEAHEGNIEIQSESGVGSTFMIKIPMYHG